MQLPEDVTTVLLEKIDEHHRAVLEALFVAERRLTARIEALGTDASPRRWPVSSGGRCSRSSWTP
jgi:hypothetical protein